MRVKSYKYLLIMGVSISLIIIFVSYLSPAVVGTVTEGFKIGPAVFGGANNLYVGAQEKSKGAFALSRTQLKYDSSKGAFVINAKPLAQQDASTDTALSIEDPAFEAGPLYDKVVKNIALVGNPDTTSSVKYFPVTTISEDAGLYLVTDVDEGLTVSTLENDINITRKTEGESEIAAVPANGIHALSATKSEITIKDKDDDVEKSQLIFCAISNDAEKWRGTDTGGISGFSVVKINKNTDTKCNELIPVDASDFSNTGVSNQCLKLNLAKWGQDTSEEDETKEKVPDNSTGALLKVFGDKYTATASLNKEETDIPGAKVNFWWDNVLERLYIALSGLKIPGPTAVEKNVKSLKAFEALPEKDSLRKISIPSQSDFTEPEIISSDDKLGVDEWDRQLEQWIKWHGSEPVTISCDGLVNGNGKITSNDIGNIVGCQEFVDLISSHKPVHIMRPGRADATPAATGVGLLVGRIEIGDDDEGVGKLVVTPAVLLTGDQDLLAKSETKGLFPIGDTKYIVAATVAAGEDNSQVVNLHKVRTMHTSTGKTYLLINGGISAGDGSNDEKSWIFALPVYVGDSEKNIGLLQTVSKDEDGKLNEAVVGEDTTFATTGAWVDRSNWTKGPVVGTSVSGLDVVVGKDPRYIIAVPASTEYTSNKVLTEDIKVCSGSTLAAGSIIYAESTLGKKSELPKGLVIPTELTIPSGSKTAGNFKMRSGQLFKMNTAFDWIVIPDSTSVVGEEGAEKNSAFKYLNEEGEYVTFGESGASGAAGDVIAPGTYEKVKIFVGDAGFNVDNILTSTITFAADTSLTKKTTLDSTLILGGKLSVPTQSDPEIEAKVITVPTGQYITAKGETNLKKGSTVNKGSVIYESEPLAGITINDIQIVGDTAYISCAEERKAETSADAGIFSSTALFDKYGQIRAWTPWQRVMGSTDKVYNFGVDTDTSKIWAVTEDKTKIKVTEWGKGDTSESGLHSKSPLSIVLDPVFSPDGITGLFAFDDDTTCFKRLAEDKLGEWPYFSMLVATGNRRVALIQAGAQVEGIYTPTKQFVLAPSAEGTPNVFVFKGEYNTPGAALADIGVISCAEFSNISGYGSGWLFVGGQNGVAVLARSGDNVQTNLKGCGFEGRLKIGLSSLSTTGFPGSSDWKFLKLLKSGGVNPFVNVRKLLAVGTGGTKYLYVLTSDTLYRVEMKKENFDTGILSTDVHTLCEAKSLETKVSDDAKEDTSAQFYDLFVLKRTSDKTNLLIAASNGMFVINNFSDSSSSVSTGVQQVQVQDATDKSLGQILRFDFAGWYDTQDNGANGNLSVLALAIDDTAGNKESLCIYRFDIQNGSIGTTNTEDSKYIDASLIKGPGDSEYFYKIGDINTVLGLGGPIDFYGLSGSYGDYFPGVNVTNITSFDKKDLSTNDDNQINLESKLDKPFSFVTTISDPASGALYVPGKFGVRVCE